MREPSRTACRVGIVVLALCGCGGGDMQSPPPAPDVSLSSGSGVGGADGSGDDAAGGAASTNEEPATLNGCKASDYEDHSNDSDARVILIAAEGLTFTPKCLRIAPGQSVRFEGSLASHPLSPGNPDDIQAGSPDNPIEATSSGTQVEFTFGAAGTFPYFCQLHAFGNGMGMAGAVLVR